MKNTAAHIETLYKKAIDYTETSVSLYKLNAIDTSADIISSLLAKALLVLVISTFLLFLNIGLSLLIGECLGSNYLGFLMMSSVYLGISILIYAFKKLLIENPISDLVITKLQSKLDKDEN